MKNKTTLELHPDEATLSCCGGVQLNLIADSSDILDHFDCAEVIEHFGTESLLAEMDESSVLEYFGATK